MTMTISRKPTGVNVLKNLLKKTADATGVSCASIKRLEKKKIETVC